MKLKTMEKWIVALNTTMVALTLTIVGLTVSLVHDMNEQEKARQYRWAHQFDEPINVVYSISCPEVIEYTPAPKEPEYFWDPAWAEQLWNREYMDEPVPVNPIEGINTTEVPLSEELQEFIAEEIERSGVISLPTFYALMYHESRFIPTVISDTDDYGLCQINVKCLPFLQEAIGINTMEDLFDAKTNIKASIKIMEFIAPYARDEYQLLSMYHMGIEGYRSWAAETGNYATSPAWEIMELRENYI